MTSSTTERRPPAGAPPPPRPPPPPPPPNRPRSGPSRRLSTPWKSRSPHPAISFGVPSQPTSTSRTWGAVIRDRSTLRGRFDHYTLGQGGAPPEPAPAKDSQPPVAPTTRAL